MTRDEIYEHLAQVYLGKKSNQKDEKGKKQQFNAWLVINIVITVIIFASSFYGLSAFFTHQGDPFQNKIIYALNKGPIRVKYDLRQPYPSVKTFSLVVPNVDVAKYNELQFSIRGMEEGYPGIMRVELRNKKNETASAILEGIGLDWKSFRIPFEEFEKISDWSNIVEVSFILESWNAEKKKGIILIDDVCFSG